MPKKNSLDNLPDGSFEQLTETIRSVHTSLASQAAKAVNVCLTLRNWLIGHYIAEYQLNGADRAKYGEKLIPELAKQLSDLSNCNRRQLYDYLNFFQAYPQIAEVASLLLARYSPESPTLPIVPSLRAQLQEPVNQGLTHPAEKVPSVGALSQMPPEKLLNSLSYTHLKQIFSIEDPLKRLFYEVECIKGGWSVRELQRQIGSLYFERSGLSKDKKKLSELANENAELDDISLTIRDPYIFDFLGLQPEEVLTESHLEKLLLEKIEAFLLELGRGFCFEARQRRILIGETYYFIDLVFYHRILKCHILVELKTQPLTHENLGQLNTYVSWYEQNVKESTDNPPVGILLCTDNNQALAQYALAGMDSQLFVSQYQVELPTKETLEGYLNETLRNLDEQ